MTDEPQRAASFVGFRGGWRVEWQFGYRERPPVGALTIHRGNRDSSSWGEALVAELEEAGTYWPEGTHEGLGRWIAEVEADPAPDPGQMESSDREIGGQSFRLQRHAEGAGDSGRLLQVTLSWREAE